jgi:hypothetical protein
MTKICPKCGEEKDQSCFYEKTFSKKCRECTREMNMKGVRKYRKTEKYKEKHRIASLAYYYKHKQEINAKRSGLQANH